MSRRSKSAHAIALFPFLAVLICTMGALIMLLVIEMTQVRADVASFTLSLTQEAVAAEPEVDPEKQKQENEDAQWRLKILQQQRDDMAQKLADRRLELGHLDDHVGRLKQGLERLKQQMRDLEAAGKAQPAERTASAAEETRLREKIAIAQRELDDVKERTKKKPRSYAVVPYDGPNGTLRRPIYVECTADAIILQPEGITLTSDDFAGPLDAGNPLDAALRVQREYIATHGGLNGPTGEPYPLLLVRPDGAWAYAYARGAMKSWDAEFGYELLDADMQLAYPPADAGLAETLRHTVAEARRRQQLLAAAAPARFRGTGGGFARARSDGGFEVVGGPTGFPGTRAAAGGNGPPGASDGFAPRSSIAANGDAVRSGTGGSTTPPPGGTTNAGGGPNAPSGAKPGTSAPAASPVGSVTGTAGRAPSGSRRTSGSPGSGGSSGAKAEGFAGVALAKSRGANWGLPNATDKSIPITRPIRAACSAQSLVLVPERADYAEPTEVRFEGDARAAVDRYVNVVWKYMETWGIAGSGMYWKPVLRVEVAPDGEERFAELAGLLQGSGIGIERVQR